MKHHKEETTGQPTSRCSIRQRVTAVGCMGLVALGFMLGASARADMYRSATNTPGGITAQFTITNTVVVTNTALSKLSWYGPHAWYTIQGATSGAGPYADLFTVAATNHSMSVTVSNLGNSFFVAKQWNGFAGAGACAGCHGDKFDAYKGTLHSVAYNLDAASGAFPLTSLTVGSGQTNAGGFVSISSTPQLANVGCENCHGPASWHKTSDHELIKPAVSLDPMICGGCHTGDALPQYDEWKESGHAKHSESSSTGCAVCHQATTRMAMLNEYYDNLAGHGYSLVIPTGLDQTNWTATCATCHDPHAYNTNYTAQLRYPTFSTNFYDMSTFIDSRTVKTTNYNGVVATKSVTLNTTFDSLYNPNIQVCAQCHNARGARWDGNTYGLVTNAVAIPASTNIVWVNIYSNYITTNVFGVVTNYLTNIFVIGGSNTTVITAATTNQVISVSNITSYVTYVTNGVTYVATNSDGSPCINSSAYGRGPHHSPQYNILIGMLSPDYYSPGYFNTNSFGVVTNMTHRHTTAPKQCTTCHVPSYTSNGTNYTGHRFEVDYNNCVSCHSGITPEALELKIEDRQFITTNALVRIANLLNQWAANASPDLLRTNYGSIAWEYNTENEFGLTNSLSKVGPPNVFKYLTNGVTPVGTNDNLQLKYLPEDIRRARFNLYMVARDQSLGVHNPTFVAALLNDAEARVLNQLKLATNWQGAATTYKALFSATPTLTYVGTNVVFTNLSVGATNGSWTFGDGGTSTNLNPTYAYTNAGLYDVTFTDGSGQSLTRTRYIQVRQYPTVQFVADVTAGHAPLTVTFTNTSTGTGSVEWWRWQFNFSDSATRLETPDATPKSFTYTNGGVYSVNLRGNLSGGGNVGKTNVNYISVDGAAFSSPGGIVQVPVTFTNLSVGTSNYLWNFGDGNTSTATNGVNTYTNVGTYTVTLTASAGGWTNTLVRSNFVVNPPPVASFAGSPTSGAKPLTVYFTNLSSYATAYSWDFGNGKTSTSTSPSNIYTNAGSYHVTLKAINLGVTNTLVVSNYVTVTP